MYHISTLFFTLIYRSTLLLISTYSDHFMIQPPYQTNLSPLALSSSFPDSAPSANPVFYRTYSRKTPTGRESWQQVCDRTLAGLVRLGHLTPSEAKLLDTRQRSLQSLSSGRWLWIGGTPWIDNPKNFSGGYNCTSTNVVDWQAFGLMMELAMMGCGTGAVLETHYIEKLPPIHNTLTISLTGSIGTVPEAQRRDETIVAVTGQSVTIEVGDSRRGWVDSYQAILELAADTQFSGSVDVQVSLAHVRPAGEALNGFGGVANPVKLPELYDRCARILNKAKGRQLTSVECCLLIDEAAIVVVAGNVRRSAGIRQFSSDDELAAVAKENLWQQDEKGSWRIDPERDALRMANHTRVYHHKPTLGEITAAVRKQFYSGEGAIQYAPEAIARANIDLLASPDLKQEFLEVYASLGRGEARNWLNTNYPTLSEVELDDRLSRYGLNPCFRGDMKLLTTEGYKTFKDLDGQEVMIINAEGNQSLGKVWKSGEKPVIKLTLSTGDPIFCTEDHRWMTAQGEEMEARNLIGHRLMPYGQDANDPSQTEIGIVQNIEPAGVSAVYDFSEPLTHWGVVNGFVAHNCGEIIMANNHCNLAEIHLNQIDPKDTQAQQEAFQAGALSVATLLNHSFTEARYQQSRELDPIVGVSFTGLFDFCVHAFGVDWLHWWTAGRPDTPQGQQFKAQEKAYLEAWRDTVHHTVWDYCDRHHIPKPNRCTTVQPSGTKSLLTGASPGWHPPKAQRFIRRITFRKNDPVALACMDYGYSIIPSQSDKDEQGNLLDDPFDPRCTEWLVEIPTAVTWADIPGADQIDISQFSALAQFDFYMQVQRHYTTHNTSATIELREAEVEPLAQAIHQTIDQDQGYISAALLARFDDLQTFPRLPFEPISKEEYDRLVADVQKRRTIDDFFTALQGHDIGEIEEAGPAGCDSDKCLLPDPKA